VRCGAMRRVESVWRARFRRRGEEESVQVDIGCHDFRRDEVQTAATRGPGRGWRHRR